MIIDGNSIAKEVYATLRRALANFSRPPRLAMIIASDDTVIENFLRIKKKAAQSLGIMVTEYRFPSDITQELLRSEVARIGGDADSDGLIVQLPLPKHIVVQNILDAIPLEKDIDVLSTRAVALFSQGEAKMIPPVAGAIKEILDHVGVHVSGEEVLVLGHGRLVGIPASILMRHNGAHVTVIDRPIADLAQHVRESRVIISGVGTANLITPDMLTARSVIIDAGASESKGKVVGDADPRCATVAEVFTPVPKGVGPITVAILLKNLCIAAREQMR